MKLFIGSWQLWALLSASFAALTAIFAKIGIENVNSDFATFIRTVVIMCALAAFLAATDQWQSLGAVSGRTYFFDPFWPCDRRLLGLLFPRPEDREGGASRSDRQIECRAGGGVRCDRSGRAAYAFQLGRRFAHCGWCDPCCLQAVRSLRDSDPKPGKDRWPACECLGVCLLPVRALKPALFKALFAEWTKAAYSFTDTTHNARQW